MFGFDRGLHETVTQAVLNFLNASRYPGQPDLLRHALTGQGVRESAAATRTAVPAAPAKAPRPVPAEAPAAKEPEPIAA